MGKRRGDDPRQLLFAEAFIATKGNGTLSAERAGYNGGPASLAVTASRLLRSAKVQGFIAKRLEKALKLVHGPATPEEVIQVLSDQLRGGRYFRVDEKSGEPIIDLKGLKAAGMLHLVKRASRTRTTRTLSSAGEDGPSIDEETKRVEVELYSAQTAAEILGRFFGMEKIRPAEVSPIVDARSVIVAILESGDPRARALLKEIGRRLLPGTGPVVDIEAKVKA
jgi:hypothetical protein